MLKKHLTIFLPLLIATFLKDNAIWSYLIAWFGSFYVFYVTWIKYGKNFSDGLPIEQRIMRPIFLLQAIFAGFMCCTSIFYFYDVYEQSLTDPINYVEELFITAKSQRLSLLAHISLVLGIISFSNNPSSIQNTGTYTPQFYLQLALTCLGINIFINRIPGLNQFGIYLSNVASIAGMFVMASGIKNRQSKLTWIGIAFFGFDLLSSTLTGFKENIITSLLIFFILLFPLYKRLILLLSLPTLYVLIYILPTYSNIVRQESWFGEADAETARSLAIDHILDEENEEKIKETNWEFLTERFSEIGMFNQFIKYVPEKRDYYYLEIIENSLVALVPRVLWYNKPITEEVAMERVYEAEVVNRNSIVSAKTRPVVDGYLSFGALGVIISMFLYGLFAQFAYNKSENLFKSYELGGIVIFNGCFQGLWRGNNFEFIINNMFYGFITVFLIHHLLRFFKMIETN